LFEKSSHEADAFALGLRSMTFSNRKTEAVQPEILSLGVSYLNSEAEKQRPVDFKDLESDLETALVLQRRALDEAEQSGDTAKIRTARSGYDAAIVQATESRLTFLHGQLRRLAEESAMLWWIIGRWSPLLDARVEELFETKYALVAACEAADRTYVLPPPCSAKALLTRVLSDCKKGKAKKPTLKDYLSDSEGAWRSAYVAKLSYSDSLEIVPIVVGLAKVEEFRDATAAVKVLPNVCRGFDVKHPLTAIQASSQLYLELAFLKALASIGG
jgi:GTPase-associated system helical domain